MARRLWFCIEWPFTIAAPGAARFQFPATGEKAMTKNVGSVDKIIRIVVGLALLALIVVLKGDARWWGLIGLIPLVTALMGWCPAYSLIGVSTAKSSD
jgi:hypothetical protein